MDRRTLTMNWDGLADDDDDDRFFESCNRISSFVPNDLASSGSSDDEEFDDSRMSFASAISSVSTTEFRNFKVAEVAAPPDSSSSIFGAYDMWMAQPESIKDRRKRLLQGMGLASNKDLLKLASTKITRVVSRAPTKKLDPVTATIKVHESTTSSPTQDSKQDPPPEPEPSPSTEIMLVRSRSDGDIDSFSFITKRRKEEMIGTISKQRLTRTSSGIFSHSVAGGQYGTSVRVAASPHTGRKRQSNGGMPSQVVSDGLGSFFLIKNLDTGTEFIVKEFNDNGMWNKLSDLQTGKQLTMEEFEKSVGHSPVVKELMRRAQVSRNGDERKLGSNSLICKSFRNSKRRGAAILKNIKGKASGLITDKDRENSLTTAAAAAAAVDNQKPPKNNSTSQWVKVRQHGKPCKEFTALHLCQEIQAHEGSIWTIKFSLDARYLATAGEDRVIHVWEVQECEVMPMRPPDDLNSASSTPVHPMAAGSFSERPPLAEITPMPSEKKKKGKNSSKKKGNGIPDYVQVPETVFGLSEAPVCTFKGHLDDVLDLSWSKSQLLLSSSMDKTVRLWDLETKSCLKLFAHNDYVTCIQFNPVDDDYFISGSLDAKVRIWNIPDRHVVDWTDLNEMVTAVCYAPDGQGAIIGSHKGSCRLYSTADCKLEQKSQVEVRTKKKTQSKKITGFQYAPWNPAEVLITSADSRIRILDGTDFTHKFRGFRNTTSQISASFTPNGKYVVSASEDSQVYIWRCEEPRQAGSGKPKSTTTFAHEHFPCRDVSVAVTWPGSAKNEPPVVEIHSKRHSRRSVQQPQSTGTSPTTEDSVGSNSKRSHLPPLPKKHSILERTTSCPEEELEQPPQADPGDGASDSIASAPASASSSSLRYDDSPSISASSNFPSQSWSSSWSWFEGGHGGNTVQATAWGLVIVTAGLGGEIRAYQNFGLPFKVGRQTNLFRDLA